MGRFLTVLVLATALCAGVAWQIGLFEGKTAVVVPVDDNLRGDNRVDIGKWLYPQTQPSRANEKIAVSGVDPVTFIGNLMTYDKMDAAPQVPGQILFIGQEIPEGVAQVGGVGPLMQGKIQAALVDIGDSTHVKFYRRLNEGDVIGKDEMVGLINPAKAIHGVREKTTKLAAAEAEEYSAKKIHAEAERRLAVDQRLYEAKVIAEKELSDSKLTTIKTWGDYIAKREAANVSRIDVTKDKLVLSQHYVCNKLPVNSTIVKTIYKRTGEAVKELEPMVALFAGDRLVAEGLIEIQYEKLIKLPNKRVIVEPTTETSPTRVWRAHKDEITGVAVAHVPEDAKSGKKVALVASASEDGTVCLWSDQFAVPVGTLKHPAPVRTLACSPAIKDANSKARNLLVAGLADGKIYVWDLNAFKLSEQLNPGQSPRPAMTPIKILKDQHGDAITALAFSNQGQYFASGSTDGSIVLWDTSLAEFLLYPFDSKYGVNTPHTGKITALHFTPQSTLISAGRDSTLRIWKLGTNGANMIGEPIGNRSGNIGALGVGREGSPILFDQGKTLQFLSSERETIAHLENPAGTTPFETLAEFSPDAKMVLTAGASEGRLQLWSSPVGGNRAYELRQFVTSERAPVTSACFFERDNGEVPFAISGTKDGIVYLWPLPNEADIFKQRIRDVEVTQISTNVETRQLRIGVQVPNDGRLIPGQPVTIVIEFLPAVNAAEPGLPLEK